MKEQPCPEREPVQESAAVRGVFPGVWFYFFENPDLIGGEFHESDENLLVLHYCHAGRVLIGRMQERSSLASGDLWIVPKLHEKSTVTLLSKRYSGVSMLLKPETAQDTVGGFFANVLGTELDLENLGEKLRRNQGKVIPGSNPISRVFSQLFAEELPCAEGYFRLKASELLMYLAAWEPKKPQEKQAYLEREQMERIEEIRQSLTEHLDCRLTQAEIAKQFHISLTALKRMFRNMYGITLDAYLREQRISAAKQLLLETELPVSEIAHRVGYESHSQFTSVFRSCEGQPPAEYRRNRRKRLLF